MGIFVQKIKRTCFWLSLGIIMLSVFSFVRFCPAKEMITIGCKNFTEQEILAEMLSILIEEYSSLQVKRRYNLGGTMVIFNALKNGDIDIYPEYTSSGVINILHEPPIKDPEKCFDFVHKKFREKFDLIWLAPFGFENQYVFIVRKDFSQQYAISNIEQLLHFLSENSLKVAFNPEFVTRPEWSTIKNMFSSSQFSFGILGESFIYQAIANSSIDVSVGFGTDGRIEKYHLYAIKDEKQLFPSYEAAPIIRKETLKKYPQLMQIIQKMAGKISQDEMAQMNFAVDDLGKTPYEVAKQFLHSKKLLSHQNT